MEHSANSSVAFDHLKKKIAHLKESIDSALANGSHELAKSLETTLRQFEKTYLNPILK